MRTTRRAIVRQSDGSFLADARANLEDVARSSARNSMSATVAKEVDTLAGYIATRIGRVPVRGELVPGPGRFEIEVLDADPRRVKKLKIFVSHDIAISAAIRSGGDAPHNRLLPSAPRRRRPICPSTATHRSSSRPTTRPRRLRANREAARIAHSIMLAWGWRRALIAFWRAPSRRWRCRRSMSGRCCS